MDLGRTTSDGDDMEVRFFKVVHISLLSTPPAVHSYPCPLTLEDIPPLCPSTRSSVLLLLLPPSLLFLLPFSNSSDVRRTRKFSLGRQPHRFFLPRAQKFNRLCFLWPFGRGIREKFRQKIRKVLTPGGTPLHPNKKGRVQFVEVEEVRKKGARWQHCPRTSLDSPPR